MKQSRKLCEGRQQNICMRPARSGQGQSIWEFYAIPTTDLYIPPAIEAFPVAIIVFHEGQYVCTAYEPGSFDLKDQCIASNLLIGQEWAFEMAKEQIEELRGMDLGGAPNPSAPRHLTQARSNGSTRH
jgi:hypothetical protein